MKRVALFTTLMDLPAAYGLVPVILNQLNMLIEHDYTPTLLCMKGFKNHADSKRIPKGTIIDDSVPFMHLFHYMEGTKKQQHDVDAVGQINPDNPFQPITNFDRQVELIVETMSPILNEFDVVITHDLVFQAAFVVYNQAIRIMAEKMPHIKWVHWLHSGPSARPSTPQFPHILRHSIIPNSIWVSPNDSMHEAFAQMYNIPKKLVKTVYHTFDPTKFFDMHPFSKQLIERHGLLDCELLCVWATRLDAYQAKGCDKAIWLMGQFNKFKDAKMVFLNSWCNNQKAKQAIASLRRQADEWGLPQENLIFSSEEKWDRKDFNVELGVPQKVVKDLLSVAEIFILASQTETFSMAMVEAAATKCICILNKDLNVMEELGGNDVLYSVWGSDHSGVCTKRSYAPSPQQFFYDEAKRLIKEIESNKALMQHRKVLRKFNSKWVWENQMRELIE